MKPTRSSRETSCKIPKWARQAFRDIRPFAPAFSLKRDEDAVARHKALVRRVIGRWLEIEQDVLPAIELLPDMGKRLLLWRALEVARSVAGDHLKKLRAAGDELRILHSQIQDATDTLKKLIDQVRHLRTDFGYSYPYVDLWDCIDDASERYPDWAFVLKEEWRKFSIIARGQSRPGPDLVDILESFLMLSYGGEDQIYPPSTFAPAIVVSQQSGSKNNPGGADKTRLLIHAVNINLPRHNGGHIPPGFRLPGNAMAVLADVIFDWPSGTTSTPNIDKHTRKLLDEEKQDE